MVTGPNTQTHVGGVPKSLAVWFLAVDSFLPPISVSWHAPSEAETCLLCRFLKTVPVHDPDGQAFDHIKVNLQIRRQPLGLPFGVSQFSLVLGTFEVFYDGMYDLGEIFCFPPVLTLPL